MARPRGYVLWTGASHFDGRQVVVIATLKTKNAKTGRMVQTWILDVGDLAPAPRASICGDCTAGHNGSCYVSWGKAPRTVIRAYHRGIYPRASLSVLRAMRRGDYGPVRAGAAGDPAAAPDALWRIIRPATGYTHAWRVTPGLRGLVMASVDSAAEATQARGDGWRTFRVVGAEETAAPMTREIECLSDSRGRTCEQCRLCDGTRGGKRADVASIWIRAHGAVAGRAAPTIRRENRLMLPVL